MKWLLIAIWTLRIKRWERLRTDKICAAEFILETAAFTDEDYYNAMARIRSLERKIAYANAAIQKLK